MQQTNIPKPFPEPDESGNIFDPKYRIMHYSPYQRILEFKEDWTDGVPTFSSTTREPHVRKGKLFRHFMKNTSPLMNTEIRRILIEHRYSCRIPHKDTRQWFATPMEYLLEENSGASLDEIETMLRNHDYPADVGIHREYRKIVQRYMDIDRLTDDLDTLAYLIFQTANISRMLYFDTTEDEHRVSPLDVLDTMLNAMPDIDYLAIYFTNENMLEFIYTTMIDIGYTGYIMNPHCMFGGTFTGKDENTLACDESAGNGRSIPADMFAKLIDAEIARDADREPAAA